MNIYQVPSTLWLWKALLTACIYFFLFFNFRIKITGIFDYPSHSEEQSADTTVITEGSLDPTLQQGDTPSKPILMVSVENVLHEPFKVTEEVKVQDTRNER